MRRIADLDAADYLAWKIREEMLGEGHVEPPTEKELSARFRKIILERPIAAAQEQKPVASTHPSERQKFEDWYTLTAFDIAANPIGSRDCHLQWVAWWERASLASHTPALGWVMVPAEPTEAMIQASHKVWGYTEVYKDMLAAAPKVTE